MRQSIFMILFLIVFLGVFSGCQQINEVLMVEKPKVSLAGVKFGEVGFEATNLIFDVKIENPYSVDLPLLNMDYALSSRDVGLFSGKANVATMIGARGSEVVSLPVKINNLEIVKAFSTFSDVRPGSLIDYKASGGLSVETPVVGELRLPLSKTGQFNVPEIPDAASLGNKLIDVLVN